MLLERENLESAYEQILDDAAAGDGAVTVLILVAPDCDAICACRMLTFMLRGDDVNYKILPVSSYGDIMDANEQLIQDNADLRSVVMFNCGAVVNLQSILSYLPEQARCYVLDAHQPVHLANVHCGDRVVVLADDDMSSRWRQGDLPSDGEDLSGAEDSADEDSDDEDSDDEAQFGGDTRGAGAGDDTVEELAESVDNDQSSDDDRLEAETRAPNVGGGMDSGSGSDSEEEERRRHRPKGKKRKRAEPSDGTGDGPNPTPRRLHTLREQAAERRQRLRQYYIGSYYSTGAAVLTYELATQLQRDTNDLLWLAIVGLTDQFVHGHMDRDTYVGWTQQFQQHVIQRNPIAQQARSSLAVDGQGQVFAAEQGKIVYDMEFRFMLHRHWSLYDSMYYSNYVASKLSVWRTNGRSRLEEFLAKMGVGRTQYAQKYSFMSPRLKASIRAQIEKYGEEYGLDDVFYGSFSRYLGFKSPISAADMVYGITALLEHTEEGSTTGASEQPDPGQQEGDRPPEPSSAWMRSFNLAYDALSGRKPLQMRRGLELSMATQKAVVAQAVSLIEKGGVVFLKHFRYAYIHAKSTDERLFTQPLALAKLATFLLDIHRENGKWAGLKARPLVILAERPNTYLVVGSTCPEKAGDVAKNSFGQRFRLAAESIRARFKHDGFQSWVMEIDRDSVQQFVESLHYQMGA